MSRFDEATAALDGRDWSGATVEDRPTTGTTVVQSVRMPRELVERVFAESQRRGTTPSEVIRDLVTAGLGAVEGDTTVTVRVADLHRAIDTIVSQQVA